MRRACCLGLISVALLPAVVRATTAQGSDTISRTWTDVSSGQLSTYTGSFFLPGVQVGAFSLFADEFVGQREVTPVLYEQTSPAQFSPTQFAAAQFSPAQTSPGFYAVRGAATGDPVTPSVLTQAFAFGLQYDTPTTANSNYTFGFINAFVNRSGLQTSYSPGAVEFNTIVGGAGITNAWVFTPTVPNISLALRPTFALPSQVGNFALNNPVLPASYNTNPTYSALLDFATVEAPESVSFTLAAIGGLMIIGALLFRVGRRKRRFDSGS